RAGRVERPADVAARGARRTQAHLTRSAARSIRERRVSAVSRAIAYVTGTRIVVIRAGRAAPRVDDRAATIAVAARAGLARCRGARVGRAPARAVRALVALGAGIAVVARRAVGHARPRARGCARRAGLAGVRRVDGRRRVERTSDEAPCGARRVVTHLARPAARPVRERRVSAVTGTVAHVAGCSRPRSASVILA